MGRSTVHFARERPKEIESRLLEGGAGSDARGRERRHLLFEGFLEGSLTLDAVIDRRLAGLEPLEDPNRLSKLSQSVFRACVALVDVKGPNEGLHVSVVAWENL